MQACAQPSVSCAPTNLCVVSERTKRTQAAFVTRSWRRPSRDMALGKWIGAQYRLSWLIGVCLSTCFAAPLLRTENEGERAVRSRASRGGQSRALARAAARSFALVREVQRAVYVGKGAFLCTSTALVSQLLSYKLVTFFGHPYVSCVPRGSPQLGSLGLTSELRVAMMSVVKDSLGRCCVRHAPS